MGVPVIGEIIAAVGSVIDELHTSGEEKNAAALERLKLVQRQLVGQQEINREEAGHASVFVAGWRPMVGWVCAVALAYAAILEPVGRFLAVVLFGYRGEFPAVDTSVTMQVLLGMLGLGVMRSWEGSRGVKRSSLER
ncbi:3TM-type holin [Chlorobium sp. N1]|uniref:3TM-type holin n=1 Tax=Chlorobium sp. N1 TaxID=2491138 RepID=UPI0010409639|nr:3TM-type holin [Chlorobium sp. N1]TCD47013.1 hypothetical protein E0L29_10280 [Chlorobium sp. N1]